MTDDELIAQLGSYLPGMDILYYACEDPECEEWPLPASKYDPARNLKYCTRPGHRRKRMDRKIRRTDTRL